MALQPGARLGPYQVETSLGAGGMGEVYRASDSRLNRRVALKVFPAAFAGDSERMARFQREAQVLASLNHPNIATLYGLEESGGTRALVMEPNVFRYAVGANGQRFLISSEIGEAASAPIIIVQNWTSGVKR